MSDNKLKYFEVQQTSIVKALNMDDAVKLSHGRRGISGTVLGEESSTTRIPATKAKTSKVVASN